MSEKRDVLPGPAWPWQILLWTSRHRPTSLLWDWADRPGKLRDEARYKFEMWLRSRGLEMEDPW